MNRKQIVMGLVVLAIAVLGVAAWFVFGPSPDEASPLPAPSAALQVQLTAYDRSLGSPHAPIQVVEYAAPSCPFCAHFDMTLFPQLKRKYIDTGKVYYVLRVFPLSPADIGAEAIARCLPKDNYFQFIDLLWRNQDKWDPENGIQDVHAGLVQVGGMAGLSSAKVDACIADTAEAERASQVGDDAQTKYGIHSVPTFIVNGEMHTNFTDWQSLHEFLDSKLAKVGH
jgi:protein-disulfide isomerase